MSSPEDKGRLSDASLGARGAKHFIGNSSRQRSDVWRSFRVLSSVRKLIECRICERPFRFNGPSNMKKHLMLHTSGQMVRPRNEADDELYREARYSGHMKQEQAELHDKEDEEDAVPDVGHEELEAAVLALDSHDDAPPIETKDVDKAAPHSSALNTTVDSRRKRSGVWEHFRRCGSDGKAQCLHCGALLSNKGSSTSSLVKHLRVRHRLTISRPDADANSDATEYVGTDGDDEHPMWRHFMRSDEMHSQCRMCQRHFVCGPHQQHILANHLNKFHGFKTISVGRVPATDADDTVGDGDEPTEDAGDGKTVRYHQLAECAASFTVQADGTCVQTFNDRSHVDQPRPAKKRRTDGELRKSPRRSRSIVWEHFERYDEKKARCLYCSTLLAYLGGSTSNLGKHLQKRHRIQGRFRTVGHVATRDAIGKIENSVPLVDLPPPPASAAPTSVYRHFARIDAQRQQCRLCSRQFAGDAQKQRTLVKHLIGVHFFTSVSVVEVPDAPAPVPVTTTKADDCDWNDFPDYPDEDSDDHEEEEYHEIMDIGAAITVETSAHDTNHHASDPFLSESHHHTTADDDEEPPAADADETIAALNDAVPFDGQSLEERAERSKASRKNIWADFQNDFMRKVLTEHLSVGAKPAEPDDQPPFGTERELDDLTAKYLEMVERIRALLRRTEHVALTAAMRRWRGGGRTSQPSFHLAITAHFITQPDWRAHAVLLNCGRFAPTAVRSTRAIVSDWLLQACTFWGITPKVFAIVAEEQPRSVSDGGALAAVAKQYGWSQLQCLDRRLGEAITQGLLTNEFECMRLRFRSLFAKLGGGDDASSSLAKRFRYFCARERIASSANAIPRFECDDCDGVDVGVQWRRTYEDLQRMCAIQAPLDAALESHMQRSHFDRRMMDAGNDDDDDEDFDGHPVTKLTSAEWMAVRAARHMLQLFDQALRELCCETEAAAVSTPKTIVLLQCMQQHLDKMRQSAFETSTVREMAEHLQQAVNAGLPDVECDLLLAVCMFLDPRFMARSFQRPHALRICRLHIEMLAAKSKETDALRTGRADESCKLDAKQAASGESPENGEFVWHWLERQRTEQRGRPPSHLVQAQREIEFYMEQPMLSRKDDPLRWWRRFGAEACPRLARLAGKYLALPATCAMGRRALAGAERLARREWRLARQTAKMVVFMQENEAYYEECDKEKDA